MNPDELFEAAVNDPTLWEGYEEWLDEQEGDGSWRMEPDEDLDARADYLDHLEAVGGIRKNLTLSRA